MQTIKNKHYNAIIIGGGAAGISAALWSAELGLRAILLESSNELGGQLLWTYNAIKNHLGIEVENGREMQQVFLKQIQERDFELKTNCEVVEIDTENKQVKLKNDEILSADALIIATGIRRRKLNLENEEKFQGRGIFTSGKRDAEKAKGKKVCIIGGGDAALENALIVSEFADEITLIHRRKDFRGRLEFIEKVKQNEKITILTETVVTKITGQESLESLALQNLQTNQNFNYPTDFFFFDWELSRIQNFCAKKSNLMKMATV
ncbi:MAG: FAD-dependent oxidoreductase [Blastocatellia bacterium]|nr:FAD-dependent oxidoreductase [Blastocatellia bacterium]